MRKRRDRLHVIAERRHAANTRLSFCVPHADDVIASSSRDKAARAEGFAEGGSADSASMANERNWRSDVSYFSVPLSDVHDLEQFVVATSGNHTAA